MGKVVRKPWTLIEKHKLCFTKTPHNLWTAAAQTVLRFTSCTLRKSDGLARRRRRAHTDTELISGALAAASENQWKNTGGPPTPTLNPDSRNTTHTHTHISSRGQTGLPIAFLIREPTNPRSIIFLEFAREIAKLRSTHIYYWHQSLVVLWTATMLAKHFHPRPWSTTLDKLTRSCWPTILAETNYHSPAAIPV